MAKYNWNIDTLMEKLDLIQKLIPFENDPDKLKLLQRDYSIIEEHIEDYFEDDYTEQMKLLEYFIYIKDNFQTIEYLWPEFLKFASTVKKPIITPELKRNSLNNDDLLSITHDFYKSLNRFYFSNFMKNFGKRHNHIVYKRYNYENLSGETLALPSLKENYIEIYRDYTNEDILTTIHEYSHAISSNINPNHLSEEKSIFTEIDSLFMEIIASDYISNLFHDNTNVICKSNVLNDHYSNARDYRLMINLIKAERKLPNGFTSNKELKTIAKNKYQILPEVIDDVIGNPNLHNIIYLTSYMFAIELYKVYKEDKEKALHYLKKIIELDNMSELEYYNNIIKLGLIPNLSTKEYYEIVLNDALKLTRRKDVRK